MSSWGSVVTRLSRLPFYRDVILDKTEIPHPSQSGFKKSIGEIKGQVADWRLTLRDGSCLHVVEFPQHYSIHRDQVNPDNDPLGHIVKDAPHWILIGVLALLAIVGIASLLGGGKTDEHVKE